MVRPVTTSSGVCWCATRKSVLGVQRQDVNGEWGTVLRDVGSFYITNKVRAVVSLFMSRQNFTNNRHIGPLEAPIDTHRD